MWDFCFVAVHICFFCAPFFLLLNYVLLVFRGGILVLICMMKVFLRENFTVSLRRCCFTIFVIGLEKEKLIRQFCEFELINKIGSLSKIKVLINRSNASQTLKTQN